MGHRDLHRRGPIVGSFSCWLSLPVLSVLLIPSFGQAEVRIVSAAGEHVLGAHDTKEDAIRLATEAARRDALEQVATYLESVTVSTDFDLTRDEIRMYSAGVVNVLDEHLTIAAEGETVTFHIDLSAQIDTEEVAEAVKKLREHEEVRQELAALKAEVDQLHQELDQANQALATGLASEEESKDLADQRAELLNHVQSDGLVQQAWTEWLIGGPSAWPYGSGYPAGVSVPGLLAWAGRLYPNNPHVPVVTHIVTARTGIPLPAPPPAQPGNSPSIPPHHQLVSPLQVPANAVIGNAPGGRGFGRLQSMFPQYGATQGAQSPVIMKPPSSSNAQPPQPQAGNQPVSSQRLRQFLAPPSHGMPPGRSAVSPPRADPWGSRGFSRLQPTHPGFAPRSGQSYSSGGIRSGGGSGRGSVGGRR